MGKNPAQKAKKAEAAEKETKVSSRAKTKAKTKSKKSSISAKSKGHSASCKVSSCKREYRAKGYCRAHYKQWRQGKFGVARYKTCKAVDCKSAMAMNRHGYCETHFQNFYVKGMAVPAAAPAEKAEPAQEKVAAG